MNLLTSFKNLLIGNSSPVRPKRRTEDVCLKTLQAMQSVCSKLPGGKIFVSMDVGELNLYLKWNADEETQFQKQAFELDGKGRVTLYEEIAASQEDTVKPIVEAEVEEAGTNHPLHTVKPMVESEMNVADVTLTEMKPAEGTIAETKEGATEKQDGQEEKPIERLSLMQRLNAFFQSHYAFRYNLLTEQVECAMLDEYQDESHTLIYTPVDNRVMNGICLDAMDEGIACWDRDVKRYIESDRIKPYHPFQQYFENLPQWDGRDRLQQLAGRVSTNELWINSFHTWMLGLTAQWMNLPSRAHANSVMPILISTRQGMGKSTFCRSLMPAALRRYYTDSYDLSVQSSCELKLATFGLINIDEFDKLSTKKTPLLKNLMQMKDLNIRKAYKRSTEPLERIASFIGTSNRCDLLSDNTGSRRFFCIEVDHYIDTQGIDMDQVYAQLKHELLGGKRYWFTKEEEVRIQKHNLVYYKSNLAEEAFHSTFRMAKAGEKGARLLTASDIYMEMKRTHAAALRGVSCTAFARLLPELGERVHTRYCNGYWVVKIS